MVDVVEEAFEVGFNYEPIAAETKLMTKRFDRIACSNFGAIAIAARQEVFIDDRAQNQCGCNLMNFDDQNR